MTITSDVLIVGGGIVGLWLARYATKAGLKTVLVEKEQCGSGGSGGVLGALLPHLPNAMNPKNKFQFDALVELSSLVQELEDETQEVTGYVRCGRAMPIRHEGFLKTARLCEEKSSQNWKTDNADYVFEIVSPDLLDGWMDLEKAPLGLAWDNLAAKVHPQLYLGALKASLEDKATIIEGLEVIDVNQAEKYAITSDGTRINSPNIIFAAGYQSYELLQKITGVAFGTGVKGQAAIFNIDMGEQKPVLYDDGMYIVHHAPGTCAVGSTTEPDWQPPVVPDEKKTHKFLNKAFALCPQLKNAECVGLWAGIRPKSLAKDPMIGRLHADSPIIMATGGFKISFGIAHRIAEHLILKLTNSSKKIDLPETYKIEHHITCAIEMGRITPVQQEQFQE